MLFAHIYRYLCPSNKLVLGDLGAHTHSSPKTRITRTLIIVFSKKFFNDI